MDLDCRPGTCDFYLTVHKKNCNLRLKSQFFDICDIEVLKVEKKFKFVILEEKKVEKFQFYDKSHNFLKFKMAKIDSFFSSFFFLKKDVNKLAFFNAKSQLFELHWVPPRILAAKLHKATPTTTGKDKHRSHTQSSYIET